MDYNVKINTNGNKISVKAPYSTTFVETARNLDGKWSAASKEWAFDIRDRERVEALVRSTYGTLGEAVPTCTVQVSLNKLPDYSDVKAALWTTERGGRTVTLGGQVLVHRPGRDHKVRLGDRVQLISGGFEPTGGSMKNPAIAMWDDTVLEVKDVPTALAEAWIEEMGKGITIVEGSRTEVATEATVKTPKEEAIEAIRAMMATHGITVADLA